MKDWRKDRCWIWKGATSGKGYACVRIGPKTFRVSRIVWLLYRGSIPKGMHVCHRCDTPTCINLHHLFLGTNRDNIRDSVTKGRWHVRPKLSETDCQSIRQATDLHKTLAKRFNVCVNTISKVKNNHYTLQ